MNRSQFSKLLKGGEKKMMHGKKKMMAKKKKPMKKKAMKKKSMKRGYYCLKKVKMLLFTLLGFLCQEV